MKNSLLGLYLICLLFSSSIASASASQYSEFSETFGTIDLTQNSEEIQTSNSLAESISVKDSYVMKKNGFLTHENEAKDNLPTSDSLEIAESVILSKQSLSQSHSPVMAILERILERSKLSKQYDEKSPISFTNLDADFPSEDSDSNPALTSETLPIISSEISFDSIIVSFDTGSEITKEWDEFLPVLIIFPIIGVSLINYENKRTQSFRLGLSYLVIIILISSVVISPLSLSSSYWGFAYGEIPELDESISVVPSNDTEVKGKPADSEKGKPADSEKGKPANSEKGKPANSEKGKPAELNATNTDIPELDESVSVVPSNGTSTETELNATNTDIPELDESVSVVPSNGTSTETELNATNTDIPELDESVSVVPSNATIIEIPQATISLDFDYDLTKFADEEYNDSLELDGEKDFLQIIENSIDNVSYLTVSAWVKPDYSKGSPEFTVISKEKSFSLSINNNIQPEKIAKFSVFDGIKWTSVESKSTIDEEWTFLAATFDGDSISIIVNTEKEATQPVSDIPALYDGKLVTTTVDNLSSEKDIVIGAYVNTNRDQFKPHNKFSGEIDNVLLYDSLLNESIINQIYNQKAGYYSNLDPEISFEEILESLDTIESKTILTSEVNATGFINTNTTSAEIIPTNATIVEIQEFPEIVEIIPTNATIVEIQEFPEIVEIIPTNATIVEIIPANVTLTPHMTKMKESYLITEDAEFVFEYYTEENLKKAGKEIKQLYKEIQHDKWEEQDETVTVEVFDPEGNKILLNSEFDEMREGKFNIKLLSDGDQKPGLYKIKTTLTKNGETFVVEDEFAWGLVSLNTKKSIYRPGETAEFVIVVLDSEGHPVCDANLSMTINGPDSISTLSSGNGITTNQECGLYDAQYSVSTEGTYSIDINALANGINTNFETSFDVASYYKFDIIRTAQSKIDPINNPNSFNVRIDIESFVDVNSIQIQEFVPSVFEVTTNAKVKTIGETKILTWNKGLIGNKTYVEYSYAVPLVFPELYALGPLEIKYDNEIFTEARPWFVANDPTDTRFCTTETINTGSGVSGTGCGGTSDTDNDNNVGRVIQEEKLTGKWRLDADYIFTTTINENDVVQLDITIEAFTEGEVFSVFLRDFTNSQDDDSGIDISAPAFGTTQTFSACSGGGCTLIQSPADYIDTSGNMQITFLDDDPNDGGAATNQDSLTIDIMQIDVRHNAVISATDTPAITDNGILVKSSVITATDTPAITDNGTVVKAFVITATDTPVIADNGTVVETAVITATDTPVISDSETLVKSSVITATDTPVISDSETLVKSSVITATDTPVISDSETLVKSSVITATDTILIQDGVPSVPSGNGGGGGSSGLNPAYEDELALGIIALSSLKIVEISYDVCDKNIVRILVSSDDSSVPTVTIQTKSGIIEAKLVEDQPFKELNAFTTVDKFLYEAQINPEEQSFTVKATAQVGTQTNSVTSTIQITECEDIIIFEEAPIEFEEIVLPAPQIYDVKFQIDNEPKQNAESSSETTYLDNQKLTVSAIIHSETPIELAELRYIVPGQPEDEYSSFIMDITPLQILNTASLVSASISSDAILPPAITYWIYVIDENSAKQESKHYSIGVKPTYSIDTSIELDITTSKSEGSSIRPTAYVTNNALAPAFGTISLIANEKVVSTKSLVLEPGQTPVDLEWKVPKVGSQMTYEIRAEVELYGDSIATGITKLNTFPGTEIISISEMEPITSFTDEVGNVVAKPTLVYASDHYHEDLRFKVILQDGYCLIGASEDCAVRDSTLEQRGGVQSVEYNGNIYRIFYTGPYSPLERFSITSVDDLSNDLTITLETMDYFVPQAFALKDIDMKVKYSAISEIVTVKSV